MKEKGVNPEGTNGDDLREVMITIPPDSTRIIATWFVRLNGYRRRAKVRPGVLSQEEYDGLVYTRLERKLTEAANAATPSGASFLITYEELDILVLQSIGHEKPLGDADFRAGVVSEDSDMGIAFFTGKDHLKLPLKECLESFVENGGNDRFGYLGVFRRIANRKVGVYHHDDGSTQLFDKK